MGWIGGRSGIRQGYVRGEMGAEHRQSTGRAEAGGGGVGGGLGVKEWSSEKRISGAKRGKSMGKEKKKHGQHNISHTRAL